MRSIVWLLLALWAPTALAAGKGYSGPSKGSQAGSEFGWLL